MMSDIKRQADPIPVAEAWERWCGETQWSKALREFAALGGRITWWCGYPQSVSAIPLCFTLHKSTGEEINGGSRLKDIKAAIAILA